MDKKKIIVIEDESEIRETIVELLSANSFKVFPASNGKDGIKLLREVKPDLILCDIMMPELNGYWVLEIVRQDDRLANIPFIFLTAKAEMDDLRDGMIKGADDYVVKPFEANQLVNSINTRLKLRNNFLKKIPNGNNENAEFHKDKILLNINGVPQIINISNIIGIKGLAEYTNVFLLNDKKIIIRKLLKDWEEFLPREQFVRIHKSSIINYSHIDKIQKHLKRSFKVKMNRCDEDFIISERYASKLREKLKF